MTRLTTWILTRSGPSPDPLHERPHWASSPFDRNLQHSCPASLVSQLHPTRGRKAQGPTLFIDLLSISISTACLCQCSTPTSQPSTTNHTEFYERTVYGINGGPKVVHFVASDGVIYFSPSGLHFHGFRYPRLSILPRMRRGIFYSYNGPLKPRGEGWSVVRLEFDICAYTDGRTDHKTFDIQFHSCMQIFSQAYRIRLVDKVRNTYLISSRHSESSKVHQAHYIWPSFHPLTVRTCLRSLSFLASDRRIVVFVSPTGPAASLAPSLPNVPAGAQSP